MVRSRVQPIRAPRGNNLATVVPDRQSWAHLIRENRDFWTAGGVPAWIKQLRTDARQQLGEIARQYTRSYLPQSLIPTPELSEEGTWIVGGHQPELFHPGVWYKNVLIDRIAKENFGFGLHAIVDHDLARATAIRVPDRDLDRRRAHALMISLPLVRPDTADPLLPWNAWGIDSSKISSTRQDIERALRSVGITRSMACDYFEELGSLSSHANAAIAMSQVRHRMECRHGIGNWEFPISDMCRSEAWSVFVEHCISNAENLNRVYNECLEEYRLREGIRNPTQPVPRLGRHGEWLEVPFWIRLPGQYARRRMWVARTESGCQIAPEPTSMGPVAVWCDRNLSEPWLIWPRALTNTLFLRVFIADLFVHGIGGGQYDRLTDAIIERYLGLIPPKFVTCTATLWLSLPWLDSGDEQELRQELANLERDRQRLRSAPEKYLDDHNLYQKNLADEHSRLLEGIPPRGQRREWHRRMVGLKADILAAIDLPRRRWDARRATIEAKIAENRILQSREFSYLLFEEGDVFARLLELAKC